MTTTKPTKKTATKKKPIVVDNSETEFDESLFDTWDAAAEEAAIQEAAQVADIQYIIVEGRIFAGRFSNGTIVKAPLTFSVLDLEEVTASEDNPVDQVKALLRKLGDEESVGLLENQNLASVVIFAEKFFEVFAKIAETALGKS